MEGGLNHRGRECVETLRRAAQRAHDEDCEALFVLGDLFDSTRPSPSLVYETMRALTHNVGDMRVVIILGNHDRQSQHDVDHACASASLMPRVQVVTKPTIVGFKGLDMLCVPYQPGEANEWLTSSLAHFAEVGISRQVRNVVLTHLGIWDESTPAFLKAARDAVGIGHVRWLLDAHKLDGLYAGNWHEFKLWGPRQQTLAGSVRDNPEVGIPGTICPHNFSDPPGYGRLLVYDSEIGLARVILTPGPRFVTLDRIERFETVLDRDIRTLSFESRSYVRVTVGRGDLERALAARDKIALSDHSVGIPSGHHYVVQIDVRDSDVRETVRAAARAAVASGDDLSGYAALAAVVDPGTPAGVERRLAAYRKEAG
jgi:hypothetical protein